MTPAEAAVLIARSARARGVPPPPDAKPPDAKPAKTKRAPAKALPPRPGPECASTRVLGIDPGSRWTGYGVIERTGNRLLHIASGRIAACEDGQALATRLATIYAGLTEVIRLHQPQSAGLEGIFHHKNAKSALILGHARGVALLACCHGGLDVEEYAPAEVKKAIAGTGRADKHQVQQMVRLQLGLAQTPLSLDQSDALAIALCHAQRWDGASALRQEHEAVKTDRLHQLGRNADEA